MKKNEVYIGMYVEWKADIEEYGVVVSLPDNNGYVNIEGPDGESGPREFNVHYSQLDKAE